MRTKSVSNEIRRQRLSSLRQQLQGLEGRHLVTHGSAKVTIGQVGGQMDAVLNTGIADVDQALPHAGLALGNIHELIDAGDGACHAMAAFLAARGIASGLFGSGSGQPLGALWCSYRSALYGPGLARFGLQPRHLLLVRVPNPTAVLWVMEEALKAQARLIVIGEVTDLDLTASRRLQLAAEAGAGLGLLLRRPQPGAAAKTHPDGFSDIGEATRAPARAAASARATVSASAAATRWQVNSHASADAMAGIGVGEACLSVRLLRCRGGRPAHWLWDWDDTSLCFRMAALLADRSAAAAA